MAFTTDNQFSEKFKVLGAFGNECNACPLFALFTAMNFMKNGELTKNQHDHNLEAAVMNYVTNSSLPKYMAFDELVMYTNGVYSEEDIVGTTPLLINEGIMGYSAFFPTEITENYAVIFLKNSNFICCLVKHHEDGKTFAIRDCHETEQREFDNVGALEHHLNSTYQFNQLTIVDGVLIEEYGNIEFLQIYQPFNSDLLDPDLYDDSEPTLETTIDHTSVTVS